MQGNEKKKKYKERSTGKRMKSKSFRYTYRAPKPGLLLRQESLLLLFRAFLILCESLDGKWKLFALVSHSWVLGRGNP